MHPVELADHSVILLLPRYLLLATSKVSVWSGGPGILTELSPCDSTVYQYNGAQSYKQFLQVGRLGQALTLLDLALSLLSKLLCVFSLHCTIYTGFVFVDSGISRPNCMTFHQS